MNIIIFLMKFIKVIGYYANLVANGVSNDVANICK